MLCSWNTNVLKSPNVPSSSGGITLSPLLKWGHFVPNYSNPCCPFKSLWEMNRVQICRKVDNKATPAITTETQREKEPQISAVLFNQIKYYAQIKLTTVDPHPLNTELLLLCEDGQQLATLKLPKKLIKQSESWLRAELCYQVAESAQTVKRSSPVPCCLTQQALVPHGAPTGGPIQNASVKPTTVPFMVQTYSYLYY